MRAYPCTYNRPRWDAQGTIWRIFAHTELISVPRCTSAGLKKLLGSPLSLCVTYACFTLHTAHVSHNRNGKQSVSARHAWNTEIKMFYTLPVVPRRQPIMRAFGTHACRTTISVQPPCSVTVSADNRPNTHTHTQHPVCKWKPNVFQNLLTANM